MKYQVKLEIFGLPRSINSVGRMHWAVKAKEAKLWRNNVVMTSIGKRPEKPLSRVRLTYTRFSCVCPDFDNLVNSFKASQDGLVDAGIIENDRVSNIAHVEYKWEKAPPMNGKIWIEVEEVT